MAKKYIDADRLIKAIEEKGLDCSFALKMERLDTLALIDELQQEQPETDGDNGKFVKILVRKEFAEQLQKLGDEIQAGQFSFVGAMNQQEQPEVDFKIEERKWVLDAVDNIFPEDGDFMSEVDFRKILKDTARHFYELGRNSK